MLHAADMLHSRKHTYCKPVVQHTPLLGACLYAAGSAWLAAGTPTQPVCHLHQMISTSLCIADGQDWVTGGAYQPGAVVACPAGRRGAAAAGSWAVGTPRLPYGAAGGPAGKDVLVAAQGAAACSASAALTWLPAAAWVLCAAQVGLIRTSRQSESIQRPVLWLASQMHVCLPRQGGPDARWTTSTPLSMISILKAAQAAALPGLVVRQQAMQAVEGSAGHCPKQLGIHLFDRQAQEKMIQVGISPVANSVLGLF